MPLDENSKLENFYDLLVEKKVEAGDDPELNSIYEEADRHFTAALEYQRRDCLDVNTNYELKQVEEALRAFDEVKTHDKGI